MKTFIKTIALTVVFIISGTSCDDFLNVVPDNIAVIEDAFETRDSAERFLATLYGYMPPFSSINNPALAGGDEILVNINVSRNWQARRMATGGQSAVNPALGYWGNASTVSNLFIALRDCNIFLENVDAPFDAQDFEKTRWVAETKFLKAYYHFYLMRMYGPIPIIRENLEASSGVEAVRVRRESVDAVANYIVELLDEAIPDLPATIQNRGDELGRISAPIAAAIKAKVLVTVASPLFNGNADYVGFVDGDGNALIDQAFDQSKWERAVEACQEAIQMAEGVGHVLYNFTDAPNHWSDTTITKLSYRGAITDPWNNEVIWGNSGRTVTNLQNWSQPKVGLGIAAENRSVVQSWWSPPLRIAEMFYSENGVPIDEDINYDYGNRYSTRVGDDAHKNYIRPGYETANLNFHREPRFYAALGFDGGLWEGHGVGNDEATSDEGFLIVEGKIGQNAGREDDDEWPQSGYWAKKLVHYENVQAATRRSYSRTPYPFPMIRLADLYLLYAEALNESQGPASAYEWIDKVRARSGLDGVVQSWATSSNDPSKPSSVEGLREIIQQERMIELVFEGQRFWDLRRWKRASEFLNSDARGWNIEGKTVGEYYTVITTATYKFSIRDYLWPIAETDIIRNSNLIQNPGW